MPQRLMALGMALLLALLLPLSLGAASLVTAGSDWFDRLVPAGVGVVPSYVGPLTSLSVLWLLFLGIYVNVPNFVVRFGQTWRGALTAALLVGVLELLVPLYARLFLSPHTEIKRLHSSPR